MEFITDFLSNNSVLFGLVGLIAIGIFGRLALQWYSKKTGVNTDELQEELKKTAEDAQVEAAKELKKTVEKMLTADEADEVIKMVKEGSLVELTLNAQGDIIYVEHSFAKEHDFDKDKMLEATFNPKTVEDKPLLITIPKSFSHNEEIEKAIAKVRISVDPANGETTTFETGPDESVRIIGKTKNKYALRDETGKFVKADTEIGGTTEKRKVGRPRKVW